MSEKFICAECNQTFDKERSDDEAMEEKEMLFPNLSLEECAIVCTDCFQKIMRYQ